MGELADEIDEIQGYIEKELRVATYDKRFFVPKPALRGYLDRKRIRKLLDLYSIPLHKCESIFKDYLAVFVILLFMRKGNYITLFLQYVPYSDARLPFQKDTDLPEGCDRDFHNDFDKIQWPFCAQELGPDSLSDKRFSPKMIMPITSSEALKTGPDGTTFKVEIHPDYNKFPSDASIYIKWKMHVTDIPRLQLAVIPPGQISLLSRLGTAITTSFMTTKSKSTELSGNTKT
jgi:hypothetical protein